MLLARLPFVASNYLLSVATLALYLAYVGQAWNVMMGFAGQLSLGHSLYVGLGAYASAGLFYHFGVGPWAGVWLAIVVVRGDGRRSSASSPSACASRAFNCRC